MLLKIVYVLAWRTLNLVVVLFRGDQAAAAEVLVLRHENVVLRRQAGRVRYEPADWAWFAALARIVSRRRWIEVFPVTPATLLAWHRRLAARKYGTGGRRRPGRPSATLCVPRISSTALTSTVCSSGALPVMLTGHVPAGSFSS